MTTETQLKAETEKWLSRIEKEMPKVKETEKNKSYLGNINAYISDCRHFMKGGKLILGFEAIIWAWANLNILKELKILD